MYIEFDKHCNKTGNYTKWPPHPICTLDHPLDPENEQTHDIIKKTYLLRYNDTLVSAWGRTSKCSGSYHVYFTGSLPLPRQTVIPRLCQDYHGPLTDACGGKQKKNLQSQFAAKTPTENTCKGCFPSAQQPSGSATVDGNKTIVDNYLYFVLTFIINKVKRYICITKAGVLETNVKSRYCRKLH